MIEYGCDLKKQRICPQKVKEYCDKVQCPYLVTYKEKGEKPYEKYLKETSP